MYNSTDETLNDFLCVVEEIGKLPSKTILYDEYSTQGITEYLNSIIIEEYHTKEIISEFDENSNKIKIINERKLLKIGKNIYINFIILNKQDDENSYIKDITLLYDGSFETFSLGSENVKKNLSELIEELEEFILPIEDIEEEKAKEFNVYGVVNIQGNLALQKIDNLPNNDGNIKKYYNTNVFKETKSIFKEIKKSNKGLSIFFGERGTGKTSLISYFSSKSDKKIIWIPISLIEQIIFSDVNNFLLSNKDSIIILDDSENFFNTANQKYGVYTNCLLQLIDGYFSNVFNINIILILNNDGDSIDQNLFDCNHLLGYVEFEHLDDNKIEKLNEELEIDLVSGNKLVDVFRKKIKKEKNNNIGFN